LVWYYLILALVLSAAILFGCCVVMDYSTYRDLQRRLREQRKKKPQAAAASAAASAAFA